jgi:hypothetical protein
MISPGMSTEERLRAATRAAGDTVPPGSAPPLRLSDDPAAGPHRGGAPGRRGWLRALTPLAAAAAVAGVVIASLTLTSGKDGRSGAARGHGPAAVPIGSAPPYYVALSGLPGQPGRAQIRATATGKVLATVTPPKPYRGFTLVSGQADDRTFVLAAQRWWPITSGTRGLAAQQRDNTTAVVFFRLTYVPRTRTTRLAALPTAGSITSQDLSGLAVSPDGSKLALIVRPAEIRVITLAVGSERDWIWPHTLGTWTPKSAGDTWVGNSKPSGAPLSWTADGRTLAFQLWTKSGGITEVRLLDTSAAGSSLSSSKISVRFTGLGELKEGPAGNTLITPDGSRIVTVTTGRAGNDYRLTEFSADTGRSLGGPGRRAPAGAVWDVLWTSSDGSTLIVEAGPGRGQAGPGPGILRDGRLTRLPRAPSGTVNLVW